jgi:AsmA protein
LIQLVLGSIEPTKVDISEARLRVLRREDGSLELEDLIRTDPSSSRRTEPSTREHSDLHVRVLDSTVLLLDERSGTRIELTGVQGQGSLREHLLCVTQLHGNANGGTVQLAAQLDRGGSALLFEGQIRVRDVALEDGTSALEYLVPVLAGATSTLEGKLSLDLYLRGRGDTRAMLHESLVGHGSATLDPIQLDGSNFLEEIGTLVELPEERRVGSVRSDLTIKGGKISTDNLTIELGKLPIVLAGWTDFDGRVDYRLRPDRLEERLPDRARDLLSDLTVDLDELAGVTFRGTLDAPVLSLHGADIGRHSEERPRLRELGKRLRDRVRR